VQLAKDGSYRVISSQPVQSEAKLSYAALVDLLADHVEASPVEYVISPSGLAGVGCPVQNAPPG
jgi:hypothetical protein